MPSRSNAHPSGSVTSSNRRPLSGSRPVKHSAWRPTGPRRRAAPRARSSTAGRAGTSTARVRRSAPARGPASVSACGRAAGGAGQFDERAGRPAGASASPRLHRGGIAGQRDAARASATVPSAHRASFRGLSPAPSHHLGVDVFVGTDGRPSITTTPGVGHFIGAPSVCGRQTLKLTWMGAGQHAPPARWTIDEAPCPFCGRNVLWWSGGDEPCEHLLAGWALDPNDNGGGVLGEDLSHGQGIAGAERVARVAGQLCGWVWSAGQEVVEDRLKLAEAAVGVEKPGWWTALRKAIAEYYDPDVALESYGPDANIKNGDRTSLAEDFANPLARRWCRTFRGSPSRTRPSAA